ncbi:formate--phosphoribosylaminoimidazolecarboxamide ligase [Methanonatronarchaeum sp. AMET6-2]|uniref:formate--phosphoribosylaminoimidazolecarboxamide ligase n=1 Tax=Methanonatronarchaeum sp. AMET6-2 TaxID=2933293 RepID=UPI001212BAFB|nr:formate--phosphoribosylaminoimidazolecarboxamide ligase [Methanonatronarchaeum sp. AMET6-2]RZN63499.1 MAG: formate--phosphoribosylaminoimidazolecarboxamide ligase [Methanonatronarchaeia archaeon]UOY09752.1 formate--phosphoribosylaminoimidazolecarboxamide ligase [Methanonatronarchaeum sp. AMET6-2]
MNQKIKGIIDNYNPEEITIGTIGSHSALNILKGAQEEGFNTLCVCRKDRKIAYDRYDVADEMIVVDNYEEMLTKQNQEKLREHNTVLIPHGSFNAYLGEKVFDINVPIFGNRDLLAWETDREKQHKWLSESGIKLPRVIQDPSQIDTTVIAKFPGAKGGKGYFIANSEESFHKKLSEMKEKGHVTEEEARDVHIQEYIIGVNAYPQYFRSIVNNEVEMLGMDRRYESTVDSIGKIPAKEQLEIEADPTYTVVGNIPVTARESLIPRILRMGDNVVETSQEIASPGIVGPFCLETVFTENLDIYTFEISARIVAGSNVGIGTSPYAYLKYGENMYMGKRIALEVKEAAEQNILRKILS